MCAFACCSQKENLFMDRPAAHVEETTGNALEQKLSHCKTVQWTFAVKARVRVIRY